MGETKAPQEVKYSRVGETKAPQEVKSPKKRELGLNSGGTHSTGEEFSGLLFTCPAAPPFRVSSASRFHLPSWTSFEFSFF